MEQNPQKEILEQKTLRYKLLQLFRTNTKNNILPLNLIEYLLQALFYCQLLRFSIDYNTNQWLGYSQPIFCYLDLSYYLMKISPQSHYIVLIVALAYLNIYWGSLLFSFLHPTGSNLVLNVRKLYFLITKYFLLVPLCNIVLSLFRFEGDQLNFVYSNPTAILKAVSILSLFLFFISLSCQTYLNFQFLRRQERMDRGRRSAYVPTCLMLFFITSEVFFLTVKGSQLLILNLLNVVLLVMFFLKNEHLNQTTKLIELSFLCLNMLANMVLDVSLAFQYTFSLELFFILGIFLVGGIIQLRLYSLEFQIQNINKWPTSEIIMRYTADLRYYLRAKDQYLFNIALKGYMEWHRHKCEIDICPSRSPLSQQQQKLFQSGRLLKEQEDILRCQNIIKKIYSDGYRQSPLSNQLQLENSIFLYEKGEKQLALKNLLQIEFQALDNCNYYQYSLLKQKIHSELSEQAEIKFLDLVSEMRVKHQEEQIVNNLEKVALLNLDFWSTLNEDHPDYQKLSELAFERIQMRAEVRKRYSLITSIASSQRVNGLYVHYLEAVENDQAMFNAILQEVRQEFKLDEKIVLKDWGNTSQPIMVVSVEQQKYGMILDVNSSCALLFGYQKYEMLNHNLTLLLPQQLGDVKQFISSTGREETFFLAHKSGYFIKITRSSQSYNSMTTGLAAVISLSYQLAPQTCFFALDHTGHTIVGVSSSVISLLGLEQKHFYEKLPTQDFFKYDFSELVEMNQTNDKLYNLNQLIQQKYEQEIPDFSSKPFKLECLQFLSCKAVSLQYARIRYKPNMLSRETVPSFQFQIQATLDNFKFFGCFNSHEAYLSQFSQLSYAQSLRQGPTIRNYESGITTLRLRDNIIQVIEENEQEDVNLLRGSSSEVSGEVAELPMKEEEEIFQSRRAFTQFIEQIQFGKSLLIVMTVGKLSLFALYTFIIVTMISHNQQVTTLSSQMIYNNLMGGTIAKQLSLVRAVSQMQKGQFNQNYDNFVEIYQDNLNYSSQIKFLGGDQYNLTVFLGVANVTFLNHEFFLSLLDSSNILQNKIASSSNQAQLLQSLGTAQRTALNYLLMNCPRTKQEVFEHSSSMLKASKILIDSFMRNELLLMAGGFGLILLITILKWTLVYKLNKEKQVVLDIFLDINDVQIQTFSSKTEKFLTLLHAEDLNGEIDVDQEVQNIKKLSSSTFNKQKRFRNQQNTNILSYAFIFFGLMYSGFLIDNSIVNHTHLQFQRDALDYFFMASAGQYKFYSGLAQMQSSLANQTLPVSLSKTYLQYYKEYFQLHYNTYGQVTNFHDMFTHIHMNNICQGTESLYGSTKIPFSCQLPELYPNGSYLVFIDMAMKTEMIKNSSSLTDSYLLDYQVVSLTHRKLSESMIRAQSKKEAQNSASLILALIIWIACIVALGAFFIYRVRMDYIYKLNKTKNVITILPISIAKSLPKLVHYCAKMLATCKCC